MAVSRALRRVLLLSLLVAAPFSACDCEDPGQDGGTGGGGEGGTDLEDGGSSGLGDGGGGNNDGGGTGFDLADASIFDIQEGGVVITEPDGGGTFTCYVISCDGHITQCADCEDNEGDGKVDFRDPECLGPCDNTEGPGLFSDVGGAGGNSCGVDCYFDYGNGSGGGDCKWDHRCDTQEPEDICPYDQGLVGTDNSCPDVQPDNCESYCKPFTPNGCDCFGCCTFPALAADGPDGGAGYVWIGNLDSSNTSTCTLADLEDDAKCPTCTPVANCLNECGRCELCIGKTEVPADCFQNPPPTPNDAGFVAGPDGGTVPADGGGGGGGPDGGGGGGGGDGGTTNPGQCPALIDPCGLPGQPACDIGYYCVSGCCQQLPG